jgi:hypothetical protein
MIHRRFGSFAGAAALVGAFFLAGCSGGGSGTQQQSSSGGFFGLFAKKDPNADLTLEEGKKLLAEIRKDPNRMQKLTPGEKRFLAKASVATGG